MRRARGTDGSLLSSLPWTLAALAVALLPHLPWLPPWISGALLACAGWRMLAEHRRWPLPSAWLRAGLALLCFLAVLMHYGGVSGVGPGSALLAVMAALKLLETHRRRDQFVALFIAIFLVMSSLLREQYLWSLPYLLFALLFIMIAWLRMSAAPDEPLRRSAGTGARLVAWAVPLAIAMWIFFPRIATPFWSVPIDTGTGVTGLGTSMSPGDISSLSQSDAVAFRVSFDDGVPPVRQLYWRAMVLHRFNGRGWSGNDPGFNFRRGRAASLEGTPVDYVVTAEPTGQRWVLALDVGERVDLPHTSAGMYQTFSSDVPLEQRTVYRARSYPRYTVDRELDPRSRERFLALPAAGNARSREFALRLHAASMSDAAYVEAVLQHFNSAGFHYTLRPPALGRSPVDQFLFETRRGFCEHYASTFAVLMRAAGIPARVVLGYQGGELNPLGDYLIVRQADAHAWTEVWIEGSGWRRVDPTAAVAPERIESGMSGALLDGVAASWGMAAPAEWLHSLTLTWDALNARWNEWILGYGDETQGDFLEWLGFSNPGWRQMLLTMVGLVVVLVMAISAAMMWRYRPRRADPALRLYRRFRRRTGLQAATGETPLAFAARAGAQSAIAARDVDAVTDLYLVARYGGDDGESLAALRRAVRSLRPRPASEPPAAASHR